MNELLQSRRYLDGKHPDADRLNAFVENALPEHERLETLAHLSECANCREVVSLSLPPLEDAAAVEPIPEPIAQPRPGWRLAGLFSRWNLVWIAAPALAALVILTVHLRNVPTGSHPVAVPGQVAESHPPAQPLTPRAAPRPDAPNYSHKQKAANQTAEAAKARVADGAGTVTAPATDGREAAALKKSPPPAIVADRAAPVAGIQPNAPVMGGVSTMHGSVAGTARGGALASSPPRTSGMALGFVQQHPRPVPAAPVASMTPQGGPVAIQSSIAPPMPPAVLNQASVAASGAAPANASTTIAVNAESSYIDVPIAGREAIAAYGGLAQAKSANTPGQAPLPSGLAVLSLAANLHRRVALDTRSQLFYSEDDGQHWKAVYAPWRARAIRITAVAPLAVAPSRANTFTLAVPERFTPGATATVQPGEKGGSLSGAVTDATGAAIPGATVVATDSHTALTRSAQTDAAGRYLVQELPPGVYHVEARALGFERQSQTVALTQQAVKNIVLAVGQSSQTVAVQATPSTQMHGFSHGVAAGAMKTSKPAAAPAVNRSQPVFVITTDTGDRWTSSDGQMWKPE